MVRGAFRGVYCTTALYIFELNKGVIHRDLIESKILTLLWFWFWWWWPETLPCIVFSLSWRTHGSQWGNSMIGGVGSDPAGPVTVVWRWYSLWKTLVWRGEQEAAKNVLSKESCIAFRWGRKYEAIEERVSLCYVQALARLGRHPPGRKRKRWKKRRKEKDNSTIRQLMSWNLFPDLEHMDKLIYIRKKRTKSHEYKEKRLFPNLDHPSPPPLTSSLPLARSWIKISPIQSHKPTSYIITPCS